MRPKNNCSNCSHSQTYPMGSEQRDHGYLKCTKIDARTLPFATCDMWEFEQQHHKRFVGTLLEEVCRSKHQQPSMEDEALLDTDTQVGGSHYSDMKIQPKDFILKNKLGYAEGNVVKYVSRHNNKNGLEDIQKAMQYLEFIIEDQYDNNKT